MPATKRSLRHGLTGRQHGIMPQARGLALGRRDGQSIVLELADGTDVTITVLQSNGTRCRLHVSAPPSVGIRRSELPSHRSQSSPAAQPAA